MSKLRLYLDELVVESFDTGAGRAPVLGTVRGHDDQTYDPSCIQSCMGRSCIDSCWATCLFTCISCGTCQTCPTDDIDGCYTAMGTEICSPSCAGTCEASCGETCTCRTCYSGEDTCCCQEI